jgi:predicted kinase
MDNKIILVGGYCVTGKSTFSRKLSKFLKIPCFNKDTLKETLGNGFGSENNIVYQKGSFTTFKLMLYIAERFLQTGKMCILESNFKNDESEQIKVLLNEYNAECLTFVLRADSNIVFERYIERDKVEKRHWVHRTMTRIKDFNNDDLQSWYGDIGIGQIMNINVSSFDEVNYEELYTVARKFIEK